MSTHYPLSFTLEDGIHVVVNKTANNTYDFSLTKPNGAGDRQFTYVADDRTKAEVDATLDFDQLNAVRRFWLETEDVV